jgi:hypothetical protein
MTAAAQGRETCPTPIRRAGAAAACRLRAGTGCPHGCSPRSSPTAHQTTRTAVLSGPGGLTAVFAARGRRWPTQRPRPGRSLPGAHHQGVPADGASSAAAPAHGRRQAGCTPRAPHPYLVVSWSCSEDPATGRLVRRLQGHRDEWPLVCPYGWAVMANVRWSWLTFELFILPPG